MKKLIIAACSILFFAAACTEKKSTKNLENKGDSEQIESIEKENEELKKLEDDIQSDIKEIDDILDEVDK